MLRTQGIQYDPADFTQGVAQTTREGVMRRWPRIYENVMRSRSSFGWMDLPRDREMIARVKRCVDQLRAFDTLVVVGIGGSDMGARAILEALPPSRRVLFMGDTTDPDAIIDAMQQIDWKKTVVNIISKSGDTVEPMATFFVLRERMRKAVGSSFAHQIVATTDASHGSLHELAVREGYYHLIVPSSVGGRFSALSDVGLFPCAWAGLSIEELLRGAQEQTSLFEASATEICSSGLYAASHVAQARHGRNIAVLFSYHARLRAFGRWYQQLIAESLGKRITRSGQETHAGWTPLVAIGPTDQHSQLQLFQEGPDDKVYTFLRIEQFVHARLRVPARVPADGPLQNMRGISFQDIIHAQQIATAESLVHAGRPVGSLSIPRLDAYHLGALMQWFFFATVCMAEWIDVDATNQPGVEEGKKRFWTWVREHAHS